ncbi:uncharacterized protein LOC112506223 [Cynara cardunculus var. scolymus]|uniref:uncharacterized protein LOC112506223 n=1 Tax=Cynara cardunculus var. scolymus TaxID=59895 RepID=UPI000D623E5F|nr:uncharacterized protein LOC112506223 [Cynara cardunculus var. scolymus]
MVLVVVVTDEYLRIDETTTIKCVKKLVRAIIAVFGNKYLRRPNVVDLQQLLYIGHQHGFPGTLNDIRYYLADEIYPNWTTFVKSTPLSKSQKHQLFAKKQESRRKDVERAFRVLQSRFGIVRGPSRM